MVIDTAIANVECV